MIKRFGLMAATCLAGAALTPVTALADTPVATTPAKAPPTAKPEALEQQFLDPPNSARPRVWWHWMNGNVTKDGIAKDLAWMKRVGIGGLQNFDANLATPQIVEKRLVYMTPEWKDAFRFAASEADRLGLEMAVAASPGWSETGGPWVAPIDGLKKLVWSQTTVEGGRKVEGVLPSPPKATGPYLDVPYHDEVAAIGGAAGPPVPEAYGDIAVLAYPVAAATLPVPVVTGSDGKTIDGAALTDDSLKTGVDLPRGTAESPTTILYTYDQPVSVRSATVFVEGAKGMFSGATVAPVLEASDDGAAWRKVADVPVDAAPTTVSFPAVTAKAFRLVLSPRPFNGSNLGDPAPGSDPGFFVQMMAAAAAAPLHVKQVRLSAEAVVDRFETKAGFAIARDYYALGNPDAAAIGVDPARVINLTGKVRPDGTLDWTAPKGSSWQVVRLGWSLLGTTNHPATPEATGLEVDKFDGEAVKGYIQHYLGMVRDAAGTDLFGKKGVRALLTDSIEVGAANWTPKMVAQFKRLRGYDPTPWFPALTGVIVGDREKSDRFLYDYRRTLADLMAGEHYAMVARIARENGLKLYGEALEDNRPSLGDDMAMRKFADVPMAALWTYGRKTGPNPSYLADMKGAASVAHVYGQNLAAAESMTAALAPWNYAPVDLRRYIDLEFASGINRPVIHTSVHQPVDDKLPGLSLMIFGQYFNRHESWAEMAKPWVDYIARSSLLLQSGRNVADLAYFYGEEAPLTGLYGQSPIADAPRLHAWDFIGADALNAALLNQGNELVSQGGARYRAIYLGGSSQRMTLKTLQRLAALVEGGATVIGNAPVASPSLDDDAGQWSALVHKLWPGDAMATVGQGRVIASRDADAALAQIGVAPDFRATGTSSDAQLLFVHRELADGAAWFVANRLPRDEVFEAHFRISGKQPELWHADTGKIEPVSYRIENGETVVPLTLAAESSAFVVFRKAAKADRLDLRKSVPLPLGPLAGPWNVAFQSGRGAPATITLPALAPLDQNADPGVKFFSGVATYTKVFRLPKTYRRGPLWIDLGAVRDLAQVSLNGRDLGTVWHPPYRVEASAALRKGFNTLTVKVTNTWVNRLIGDAQPGATKVTWTGLPTYRADAPLRPAGLVGPVTLSSDR
ncbi:glycosyl hydrolase [Novosphingobium sp.]|uniref:glycosyl hydrolase n=1 Tax=Novosphingobium sp. TaxID=1874826 RepID=UPI0038BA3006